MASRTTKSKKKSKKKNRDQRDADDSEIPPEILSGRPDVSGTECMRTYITYNRFTNCQNFQIGDKGTLITGAKEMLHSQNSEYNRDEVVIGMINSILNPTCSHQPGEMNLQKLETAFNRLYSSVKAGKQQTFRNIADCSLLRFIQKFTHQFELTLVGGQKIVKQRKASKKSESDFDDDESLYETENSVSSRYHSFETLSDLSLDDIPTSTIVPTTETTKAEDEGAWTQVSYSRKRATTTADRLKSIRGTESQEYRTVTELLNQECGSDLILHESETIYLENKMLFSLDIVSMWNTPGRGSFHILLGVRQAETIPHQVIGMGASLTDDIQDMLQRDYFSLAAQFTYTEVIFEGKLVGLITVPSSAGCGSPSMTVKTNSWEPQFDIEQLWYRSGNENKICKPSDFTTGLIFRWFIGSKLVATEHTNPQLSQPSESQSEREMVQEDLSSSAQSTECFKKGHCILVTGRIPSTTPNLNALLSIPWLYVFDFDIHSRDNGILAACGTLAGKRSLYISYWDKLPAGISEHSLVWCFLRGVRDIPESRADGECREWFKKTREGIDKHCQQLARFANDYTTLRIMVIWPDLDDLSQHLLKFLQRLDEFIDPSPSISLYYSTPPETDKAQAVLTILTSELQISKSKMTMAKLCSDVKQHFKEDNPYGPGNLSLPAYFEGVPSVEVGNEDQAWFREDLEVLYLESPYRKSRDIEAIEHDIDSFYRGGTMHWYTWYECGAGHCDIQRDLMDTVVAKLKQLCQTSCKSVLVTLLHAPGSGGTTLAQRILWEMHTTTACAQLKTRSGSPPEQLCNKIEKLHRITSSPVILLVDGEDEAKVTLLTKQLAGTSSIILYVKRYPYRDFQSPSHKENGNRFTYCQKGEVSPEEANRLVLKLKTLVEDTRRKNTLNKLCKDVTNGKIHYLYEFGLAAYLHEYRGVKSYVKGYLKLDENPDRELFQWQKILGYLALAYYYGQASIPCQFFVTLLGKPHNYTVSVEDFPPHAREFIVEDTMESRSNCIRTAHYIIAQEVLEQILTRHAGNNFTGKENQPPTELSRLARQNLQEFVLSFITYSSNKRTKCSNTSTTVMQILTRTVIFREYRDTAEGPDEVQHKKRPKMSKLMSDIYSSPPYTERLKVFQQLTQSFPTNPNFHAHLGRFYANWRPDDEEKAEQCFQTALHLCNQQTDGKKTDEVDEKLKLTLMHVYHMYGMNYLRKIKSLTSDKNSAKAANAKDRLLAIFQLAENACELFGKCREYTPLGAEQCHGYVGEMSARLEVCDIIGTLHARVTDYISNPSSDSHIVDFVKESITQTDTLIMECLNVIPPHEVDKSFYEMVTLYNTIFGKEAIGLQGLSLEDSNTTRRFQIAAKKLKYTTDPKFVTCLDVFSQSDVQETVRLYEENFRQIRESGFIGNRSALEMDYTEWIQAIRSKGVQREYSLEDVRMQVHNWHENLKSPFSLFYLFVVTSLLGFGFKGHARNLSLIEAQGLKDEMYKLSKFIPRPRYPREWLGKGNGIRQLVSGIRFPHGHIDTYKRNMRGPMEPLLAVSKGTICKGNKTLSGFISLDLGNNKIPVRVFYVPKVCDLAGNRFEGRRVEFLLAFTLDKGYEAFNVKPLTTTKCQVCKSIVEVKTDEDYVQCHCGESVFKTDPDPFQ